MAGWASQDFIHRTGVLVVRDPRVSSADNDTFLSMMQRYYSQPTEVRAAELLKAYAATCGRKCAIHSIQPACVELFFFGATAPSAESDGRRTTRDILSGRSHTGKYRDSVACTRPYDARSGIKDACR